MENENIEQGINVCTPVDAVTSRNEDSYYVFIWNDGYARIDRERLYYQDYQKYHKSVRLLACYKRATQYGLRARIPRLITI